MLRPTFLSFALLTACGGAASAPPPAPPPATTGGGEPVAEAPPPVAPAPEPVPAVEARSEALDAVWTAVDEAVAIPLADDDAAGWIERRAERMRAAIAASEAVADQPVEERALAAALIGHGLEDYLAAADASDGDAPFEVRATASEAVTYFAWCAHRLAALDDSAWAPWRAYCERHARAVTEAYDLAPPTAPPPPAGTTPR